MCQVILGSMTSQIQEAYEVQNPSQKIVTELAPMVETLDALLKQAKSNRAKEQKEKSTTPNPTKNSQKKGKEGKAAKKGNARENNRRLPFDYIPGSKCLIISEINGEKKRKALDKNEGPYQVTNVYTNGTVRIQRGSINERINIRRLTPFFEAEEAQDAG